MWLAPVIGADKVVAACGNSVSCSLGYCVWCGGTAVVGNTLKDSVVRQDLDLSCSYVFTTRDIPSLTWHGLSYYSGYHRRKSQILLLSSPESCHLTQQTSHVVLREERGIERAATMLRR